MSNDCRPYSNLGKTIQKEDVNLSTYEKCVLIAAILIVGYILWFCLNAAPAKSQALIPPATQQEIIKKIIADKLKNHKPEPIPFSTTVEITASGYRYQWEGAWHKL